MWVLTGRLELEEGLILYSDRLVDLDQHGAVDSLNHLVHWLHCRPTELELGRSHHDLSRLDREAG